MFLKENLLNLKVVLYIDFKHLNSLSNQKNVLRLSFLLEIVLHDWGRYFRYTLNINLILKVNDVQKNKLIISVHRIYFYQ